MKAARKESRPIGYALLAMLAAIGLGVGIVRLVNGLGPTTSLSDAYPWGLWIVYDVFFVPFSGGAFMILAIAHIYNRKEYHDLARPVVLAGFLGEIMVVAVLVMDLGRWQQFYNVLFPWYWNLNSFMFQVSLCLTIYLGVMVLEVAPAVLERLGWHRPLRFIRPLTVLIAGVGIVLSALHQSALGSLFLLMPYRLHALWWTPLLPLLFFASAAFAGLAMAILVVLASFRAFHRPLQIHLLAGLARIASVLLGLYLVLKVVDLAAAGELGLLLSEGWLSALFWAELIVGIVVPLALFGVHRFRETSWGLLTGSVFVLGGVLLNRTSISVLAQRVPDGATYVPHWMELTISLAAVAAGILLFALAGRLLPILPHHSDSQPRGLPGGWSPRSAVLAVGALAMLTILVVLALYPITRAEAARLRAETQMLTSPDEPADDCRTCHLAPDTLLEAGADPDRLSKLIIEPQPSSSPHGRVDCQTCHRGNGASGEAETIHDQVISDPSQESAGTCIACHPDLPEEFPEDRLRTPHDEVSHGLAADVYCSDCHGGVGHGFDPVSGEVICPMGICIDCHLARDLSSELTDCDACHISAHEAPPGVECNACHLSTNTWSEVEAAAHTLELVGKHAEAGCLDCHQGPNQTVDPACTNCHPAPGNSHFGSNCEDCHTPTSFQEATLPDHPRELVGAHQSAPCAGCHMEGQQAPEHVCSACHERPEDHLPGPCDVCHTPQGWTASASFLVDLAPQVSHGLESKEDCMMCHALTSAIKPPLTNHGDYGNEQCGLCHKVEE